MGRYNLPAGPDSKKKKYLSSFVLIYWALNVSDFRLLDLGKAPDVKKKKKSSRDYKIGINWWNNYEVFFCEFKSFLFTIETLVMGKGLLLNGSHILSNSWRAPKMRNPLKQGLYCIWVTNRRTRNEEEKTTEGQQIELLIY